MEEVSKSHTRLRRHDHDTEASLADSSVRKLYWSRQSTLLDSLSSFSAVSSLARLRSSEMPSTCYRDYKVKTPAFSHQDNFCNREWRNSSINDVAKLSRLVRRSNSSATRARNSAALSTIIGDASHVRRFQTGPIGFKHGDPTRKTRDRSHVNGTLARVFTNQRGKIVQDEQNSRARILLADAFETRTDPFILLISGKLATLSPLRA